MKKRCIVLALVIPLLHISCNQGRIEELESEKDQLEESVYLLKSQIESLESNIDLLRSQIANMRRDMIIINNCASEASTNASTAAYWAENGNTFLFQSCLRNMSNNFDEIVNITSKY